MPSPDYDTIYNALNMSISNHLNIDGHQTVGDYCTSDLAFAASLLAKGYKVLNIDPSNGKRVIFVFTDNGLIRQHQHDFFSNNLTVDAITYAQSIKALKNRLYESRAI